MATQTGRGGGGRDVTDGKAHAGRGDRDRDTAMDGGASGGGFGGGRTASVVGNRFGAPSASAQAAARTRNAPTNGPLAGMNPAHYGGRRTPNPSPSYDPSLRNALGVARMAPLGPLGAISSMLGAAGVPGLAPSFEGYRGQTYGTGDYDPRNVFGTPEVQGIGQAMGQGPMAAQPGAVTPAMPPTGLTIDQMLSRGPMSLNVPGPSQYGLMLPGYRWYGG